MNDWNRHAALLVMLGGTVFASFVASGCSSDGSASIDANDAELRRRRGWRDAGGPEAASTVDGGASTPALDASTAPPTPTPPPVDASHATDASANAPYVPLGAIYYVRAGASGAGTGRDWTNAWSSMSKIDFSVLAPGDTVYIAGGTYGPFSVPKSGAAGKPLVFRRATSSEHGTATGWSASFDARVIVDGAGELYGVGIGEAGAYSAQSHITIDGGTRYGIWIRNAYYGIRAVYGASGLTLRHLEIGDASTYKLSEDGIQGRGNDLVIESSYIHDNDNISTHGDGIQWFEGDRVTIRYNVWKNNGQQIYLGEGSWDEVVNDVDISYNVIFNRGGTHYNGIVLYGNATQAGRYLRFYNNTIDLEATAPDGYNSVFYPITGNATHVFENNAVTFANASQVVNTTHRNNAFDNAGAYLAHYIPSETARVVAADLGFANQAAGDYHLVVSSPLVGKGVSVGQTRDFDGKPVGATPSIGAFEP